MAADGVHNNGGVSSPGTGENGPPAYPGTNVADLLRGVAERYPERPAVIEAGGSRTWAQLDSAVDAGVAAFRSSGVGPGERVAVTLPTGADLAVTLFAVARAGLIAVPLGPSRGDTDLFADRVGALAAVSTTKDHGLPVSLTADDLQAWWNAPPDESRPGAIGGGEDLTLLARARGDRAVMLSHRSVLAAVQAIGGIGALRLRDHDRALQVLPMYHLAGWVVAFLPLTLVGGATVVPEIGFDAATVGVGVHGGSAQGGDAAAAGRRATESALEAAHAHRVTLVPGAPGFYHHLVTVPGADRALSSVRLLTSGTAPLEPDDFAQVRNLMGQPVWEGYGLSESASVVTSALRTGRPHHGSVGRPLAGIELRIVGPDGNDVNPPEGPEPAEESAPDLHDPLDFVADVPDAGEVGRIVIRGATVFSGYWPDGSGGPSADGWFVTGDIGYLDDTGELHLIDRAAEVVKVAGFTVYPREVEEVLATHPYVAEVAVIGVPASDGQEQVIAAIVPKVGTHPTTDDLSDFVVALLPPFKRPAAYHLVQALPRTEVGRLDRAAVQRSNAWAADLAPSRLSAVSTVADTGEATTDESAAGDEDAEVDVTPEVAGDLNELGTRLPGTGDRTDRGGQDTDEDLF